VGGGFDSRRRGWRDRPARGGIQNLNIEPHGLDIGARLQTICGIPGGDQWGGVCL
jgi:hypothetical protein